MLLSRLTSALFVVVALAAGTCFAGERGVSVAVLDFGKEEAGARAAERVASLLGEPREGARISVLDRGLARAAARGAGYEGSLNLSLREARDLGAAIGCDFFVLGDARTLKRSSLSRPSYFEASASVFVVSARTGRLVLWTRDAAEGATPEEAEAKLAPMLAARAGDACRAAVLLAFDVEEQARRVRAEAEVDEGAAVIDLSLDEGAAAAKGVSDPVPYRRLRPPYTETAERAEAEATVDAVAEIAADGAVRRVEIVRWAGFGLDESVAETVRRLHFRPATREGSPVAVRVLLRYNFRKKKSNED